MRTNIVIDDELLKKAFRFSRARTKKELIHEALEKYVEDHCRLDLRELRGRIKFRKGYDYKALRGSR
jgi:Arc/MetJ family transcription regulator